MKDFRKIIGKLLIVVLLFNAWTPMAMAATEPERACTGDKPDYKALEKEWTSAPTKDSKAYKKIFETAQEAHHKYVGCMFNFAEKIFLGAVKDWNSPEQACLTPEALKAIVQKTEPSQMLPAMLDAHTAYKDFLNKIGTQFSNSGAVTDSNGRRLTGIEALIALDSQHGTATRQKEMEIISSLIAVDLSFTALKELRLSLVMHVHFQCILQSLEKYRKSLGKMRNIITVLPGQLRDASVTK